MPDDFSGKQGLDGLFEGAGMDDFRKMMDGQEEIAPVKQSLDPAIYAEAFGSEAGQLVLQDMYNRYVNVTRCVPGLGADQAFYREGMAQVVFEIVANIDAAHNGE